MPLIKVADPITKDKAEPVSQVKTSDPVPQPKASDPVPQATVAIAKTKMSDSEILTLINNFLANSKVATEN